MEVLWESIHELFIHSYRVLHPDFCYTVWHFVIQYTFDLVHTPVFDKV